MSKYISEYSETGAGQDGDWFLLQRGNNYKKILFENIIPQLDGVYLPLTAGSSKPLTGDLHISSAYSIYFTSTDENGVNEISRLSDGATSSLSFSDGLTSLTHLSTLTGTYLGLILDSSDNTMKIYSDGGVFGGLQEYDDYSSHYTNRSYISKGYANATYATISGAAYTGTTNRITVSSNVINISAAYVGQTSITTLGTLTTGATGAGFTVALGTSTITGVLAGANGGTGVANTGKTITLGGSLVTSGAFDTTLTVTGTTGVTLPTTGTLATLAGSETFTNKTLTSPIINVGSDATGDIYYRSAGGAFTRLAVGSDGNVLTLASGIPSWAASSSGLTVGTTAIASGTVGRLLFETTSNVLGESANLYWDVTNSRLSVGAGSSPSKLAEFQKDQNAATVLLLKNGTGGGAAYTYFQATNDATANNNTLYMGMASTASGFGMVSTGEGFIECDKSLSIFAIGTNTVLKFAANGGTEMMRLDASGAFAIGATSITARFQIDGAKSATTWTTNGIQTRFSAATYTDTSATGTRATGVTNSFGIPTYAATNTVTVTDAATVYIAGAVAAGTNMTLTNSWSLWVDAGNCRFDGDIELPTSSTGIILKDTGDATRRRITVVNGVLTVSAAL